MGIELLQQALKAHRTGDLPSAARLYERVLRQAPGNFGHRPAAADHCRKSHGRGGP
jgi:hypothetical protein